MRIAASKTMDTYMERIHLWKSTSCPYKKWKRCQYKESTMFGTLFHISEMKWQKKTLFIIGYLFPYASVSVENGVFDSQWLIFFFWNGDGLFFCSVSKLRYSVWVNSVTSTCLSALLSGSGCLTLFYLFIFILSGIIVLTVVFYAFLKLSFLYFGRRPGISYQINRKTYKIWNIHVMLFK